MLNYSKAYYIATVRKTISNNEILNHLRKKVLHYSYIMTTAMGNTKETRGRYHGRGGHGAEVGPGTIPQHLGLGLGPPTGTCMTESK